MRPLSPLLFLALLLGANAVHAQSDKLLEAIQLQRPAMRSIAESELVACAQKSCPDLEALNLLTGFLTLAEGDLGRAETLLRARTGPAGLEPYRAYYLGTALFYARNYAPAAEQFTLAQRGPAVLARKARARLAEALEGLGEFAKANALLSGTLDSPELLSLRARLRGALGDAKGEAQAHHDLLVRFPLHPGADAAEVRLLALKPRPFSFDERLARAKALQEAGRPEDSLDELARIEREKLGQSPAQLGKVALARAVALFAKKNVPAAEEQLKLAATGDRPTALEAALIAARRTMYEDNTKARAAMAAVDRDFSAEPLSDEAGFYAGWIAYVDDKFEAALSDFERFEKVHPRSPRREGVATFRGFALFRLERYAQAKAAFVSIASNPRSATAPLALYWAARSDQLGGQPRPGVVAQYARLVSLYPTTFYAVLAAERMRELGVEPPLPFPAKPVERNAPVPADLKTAHALSKAGLYRDASELVQEATSRVRSQADAISLGHALLRFGEYGAAFALAQRLLEGPEAGPKSPDALALLYPRPFRASVERAAESQHVDPSFLWSLMRRESAFRADFISSASAYGLMQVSPQTGAKIAARLGEPKPAPEDLYSASLNIRLASWYVGALQKRFGHPALVAAAYNAGPPIVVKWFSELGKLPFDLFVETIPYRETRAYVKQAIADAMTYEALYEKKAPRLLLTLPPPGTGVDF